MSETEKKNVDKGEVITLTKPIEYNGQTYESVTLDLEEVTGEDCINIEAELVARRVGIAIAPALNNDYVRAFAVKAFREPIGADVFPKLCAKDYLNITGKVRTFLLK